MLTIKDTKNGVVINVKVQPGSSKNAIAGVWLDRLKVKINAPPEAGKANKALVKFLSQFLEIPARNVAILKGQTTSHKTVSIVNLSKTQLKAKLSV